MTAQVSDTLFVDGQAYALCVLPLNSLFARMEPRPKFQSTNTANWRGYRAIWQISDDKLYLMSVSGALDREKGKFSLFSQEEPQFRYGPEEYKKYISQIERMPIDHQGHKVSDGDWRGSNIPDENGYVPESASIAINVSDLLNTKLRPVLAEWYSGILRCSFGEILNYVHGGFGSEYEKDLIFHIESGRVRGRWIIDNRNGFNIRQARKKIKKTTFSAVWSELQDLARSGTLDLEKVRGSLFSEHLVPFEIEFKIAEKIHEKADISAEGDERDLAARYFLDKALKRVSKARLVAIGLFDLRDKASEIAVMDPALFLQTIQFDMSFLESAYDTMSSLDLPYENLPDWAETNMRQLEMLIDQEEFEAIGFSRGIIEALK